MSDGAEFTIEDGGADGFRLLLSGRFLVSTIGFVERELRSISDPIAQIDMSGVTSIDTVGAYTACSLASQYEAEITGADERAGRLIKAVEALGEDQQIHAERLPIWKHVPSHVGGLMIGLLYGMAGVVGFLGQIILATGNVIRHPSRFRGKALVRQMELVGVSALPIVGLMSFLIGIVIAQQGAVQLQQFGAESLTVNLVGRITLRELGVLMTAIMVAGRSGSAFAAQIGTMKLTEEVDAMRTIGISPIEALVLPRILASVLMMPLLGCYAAFVAIVGGAVVADVALDIPFLTFLTRVKDVVPTYDMWVGLIKAPVFGLIIGMAGCYQGMQVKGDSEQVGRRTTQAVVLGIFMVIVLDAFFAVFFTEIGWA